MSSEVQATSETKVPMPECQYIAPLGEQAWFSGALLAYGNARSSERDAFWMAKLRSDEVYFILRQHASSGDSVGIVESIIATLTNPRAGETA